MPDNFFRMRAGEARIVFAEETVMTGTLTISVTPPPSVTLYDAAGTAVSAVNGVAATNYDTEAVTTLRVSYLLDASQLEIGYYTLVFTFSATGSDGSVRTYTPSIEAQIIHPTD